DNVLATLKSQLQGRNCRPMSSDIRLKVPAAPPFRYADVTVACGKLEFEEISGLKVLTNPILLVEVLSNTTERFDRTSKFTLYQSILSFKEYLLIAQDKPCITQFVKQTDGSWKPNEVTGLDISLNLPTIDSKLTLSDVYQGIEF